MLRQHIFNNYIAACHSRGDHVGACLNTVGNNRIISAVQLLHALDADGIRTGAANFCAHFIQIVGQIHYFRLLGSILHNGNALGQRSGHQHVFGSAHAGEIKTNIRTL